MRIIEATEIDGIRAGNVPRHVACVMDGNGRWAQMRGLPRSTGHAAVADAVDAVAVTAVDLGVEWLTFYALSTENWRRSPDELDFLLRFHQWLLPDDARQRFQDAGVRIRFLGDRSDERIPPAASEWMQDTESLTASNARLTIAYAINYGGRNEIVEAVNQLAATPPAHRDEQSFGMLLGLPDMPDVDLLIRTSGELRTSGFLSWHASYAELVFTDTLWPDFRGWHLASAIAEFQQRRRRLGAASAPVDMTRAT